MGRSKKKATEKADIDNYVGEVAGFIGQHIAKIVADNRLPRDRMTDVFTKVAILAMQDERIVAVVQAWSNPASQRRVSARPKAWIRWPWEPGSSIPSGIQFEDWIKESAEILEIEGGQ
jgi:hypothetical protein